MNTFLVLLVVQAVLVCGRDYEENGEGAGHYDFDEPYDFGTYPVKAHVYQLPLDLSFDEIMRDLESTERARRTTEDNENIPMRELGRYSDLYGGFLSDRLPKEISKRHAKSVKRPSLSSKSPLA